MGADAHVKKEDILKEVSFNVKDFNKILTLIFNMDDKELDKHGPFEVKYSESKFEGTKAERYFGSLGNVEKIKRVIATGDHQQIIAALKETPGYQKPMQFKFTREQAERIANFRVVGTLMVGTEYMRKTIAVYAELLKQTISPVYEQLQFFTNNINDYFLGVTGETSNQDRKQYALNAIENAQKLETATNNAVEIIEK